MNDSSPEIITTDTHPRRWAPLVLLGTLLLALSVGLAAMLYKNFGTAFQGQWESTLEAGAQDRSKGLQTYFEQEAKQLEVLAHYPTLLTVLGRSPKGPPSFPASEGAQNHLIKLLNSAARYNGYLGVWLLGPDAHTIVAQADGEELPARLEDWSACPESHCLHFETFKGLETLYFRRKVEVEGRLLGTIVVAKRPVEVVNLLSPFQTEGESVRVALADIRGERLNLTYPPSPGPQQLEHLLAGGNLSERLKKPDGNRVLSAASRVGTTPYYVFCLLDETGLAVQRRKFLAALALVGFSLFAGISMLGVSYLKQEHLLHDLQRLKAESKLGLLTEAAPDPIFFFGPSEHTQFSNPKAEKLLGYTHDEFRNLTFQQLQADQRSLHEYSNDSGIMLETTELLSKDGVRIPVELHFRVLETQGERSTLVVARDLTERVRIQAENDRARDRLSEVQKMEAVGRLAGGIAHDFNNMLTVISAYAESVKELQDADELAGELLHAVDRAKELTGQLLTFSRRETSQPGLVELRALLDKNMAMVRRLMPADARVEWEPGELEHWVYLNPGQAEQILMNLVINARDAGGPNARVQVRLEKKSFSEPRSWPGGQLDKGTYSVLSVEDNGCGMTEETVHKIFEPFFTTKPEGQGTGLGLSTVFGILRQSGGAVVVQSLLGQGTSFEVYLPEKEAPAVAEAAPTTSPPGDPGRLKIALAEDEPSLRKLLVRTLMRAGFEVEVAENGRAAVELFEPRVADFDLLITDIVMPGMRGPEVARILTDRNPNLRVVFMSGYGDGALNEVQDIGDRFLPKPFSPIALVEVVSELMNCRTPSLSKAV